MCTYIITIYGYQDVRRMQNDEEKFVNKREIMKYVTAIHDNIIILYYILLYNNSVFILM